jgi:hypothetical protein
MVRLALSRIIVRGFVRRFVRLLNVLLIVKSFPLISLVLKLRLIHSFLRLKILDNSSIALGSLKYIEEKFESPVQSLGVS